MIAGGMAGCPRRHDLGTREFFLRERPYSLSARGSSTCYRHEVGSFWYLLRSTRSWCPIRMRSCRDAPGYVTILPSPFFRVPLAITMMSTRAQLRRPGDFPQGAGPPVPHRDWARALAGGRPEHRLACTKCGRRKRWISCIGPAVRLNHSSGLLVTSQVHQCAGEVCPDIVKQP